MLEACPTVSPKYIHTASSMMSEDYGDLPTSDADAYAAAMTGWISAARRSEIDIPDKWLRNHNGRRWNRIYGTGAADARTSSLANVVLPVSSSADILDTACHNDTPWEISFLTSFYSSSAAQIPIDAFVGLGFQQTGIAIVWERLFESLSRWEALPNGWEDEDSVSPPKQSIDAAAEFLNELRDRGIAVPTGYVAGDGEIGFRWRRHEMFASVAFLADLSMVSFIRDSASDDPFRLDVPFALWNNRDDLFDRLSILR